MEKEMRNHSQLYAIALLLSLVISLMLTIQPVRAMGAIYILPDGSIDPPSAPVTTVDKITYTLTADNSESIIVQRSNIVLDGLSHTINGDGSGNGLELSNVVNVTVKNTRIQHFTYGVYLESASSIILLENNITLNDYDGIWLLSVSTSLISDNRISSNGYDGIEMYDSHGNNITKNFILSNGWFGIGSYDSSNNRISENRISDNYNGIEVFNSPDTAVFRNNFINHTTQVSILSTTAVWDNGWDGNYWDDFVGSDLNGDGISETPYTIDTNNVDRFPLMNPFWNLADVNHDLRVDMRDIGIVAAAFGGAPGNPKWNPHADITGRYLIPDGVVDMRDIGATCALFGARYAP